MSDIQNISAEIAAHAASVTYDSLSAETRHATRRALLDAVGVMLAATGLAEDARPYRSQAASLAGPSRLLGSSVRTSPAMAAFANGALAHALDFGDTFDAGPAHPNAALVPALLALADADPAIRIADLIAAMAMGGDLACRFALAPARAYEEGGWYPPPLVNLIASAAACAKLIGLDADGIRHAMGLAMLQGSFPGEIKYDPTSPLRGVREAFAARGAMEAALLARAGARGFADPLGGRGGFFAVYGGGVLREPLFDRLGERFLGDEVSFKPWPACRGTHAYIECALALRDRIDPDAISEFLVETGPIQEMLIRPVDAKAHPTSAIDARFSIPFTVAAALIDGAVTLETFLPESLGNTRFQMLGAKAREVRNPEWGRADAASGSLTIILAGGRQLHHRVAIAAGHPTRPLSDALLVEKFGACAQHSASPYSLARVDAIAARILGSSADSSASALLD